MRVLLADDEPKVTKALRLLLEHQTWIEVVGVVEDANDLMGCLQSLHADLLLLDWHLGEVLGSEVIARARRVDPELKVVVISGMLDKMEVALRAGAHAFVSKADPPEDLLSVIRSCLKTGGA